MGSSIVEPSTRVHAAMQSLLLEHGSFTLLELLIDLDAVSYSCYEAWRRGSQGTLTDCVTGGESSANLLVDVAAAWADRLDLERRDVEYFGWEEHEGIHLIAADDAELNRLLCTEYVPKQDRAQLDLFFDGAENVAVNALLDALAGRDSTRAQVALDNLSSLNPSHRCLADASTVIVALEAAPIAAPATAHHALELMENIWLPASERLLGPRARDVLAPVWRQIGGVLAAAPFEPEHPRRHPSYAYGRCLDWENVRRVIRATDDYRAQPVLLVRLAEAERRLGHRNVALEIWFQLCWNAGELMCAQLESTTFPDHLLRRYWQDAGREDMEPELTIEFFPTWVLLRERGIALALPTQADRRISVTVFELVRSLLLNPEDHALIEQRGQLQRAHAGLFAQYLLQIDVDSPATRLR
ncbi:MAG: hypothetical protein O7E57_09920 [Gammaproteobacteria bacterium]|nr:hypothetical protein [Gammaproteobacteria bacterium]